MSFWVRNLMYSSFMWQIYTLFPSVARPSRKKFIVTVVVIINDLLLEWKRLLVLAYSLVDYTTGRSPVKGPPAFGVVFNYRFFCGSAHVAKLIKNVRYVGGLGYI